jgi:hypothetical protein
LVVSLRSCGMPVNIRDGGLLATGELIGYLHDDRNLSVAMRKSSLVAKSKSSLVAR